MKTRSHHRRRTVAAVVLAALWLAGFGTAHAKPKPNAEQRCARGRYAAAAKYATCQEQAIGKFFDLTLLDKFENVLAKCSVAYAEAWTKLQDAAAGTGSTCDHPRFAGNGDGTVTDRLTGLLWEMKTDDETIHDEGNLYTWSSGGDEPNGTAFTDFLRSLNSGTCFAGRCDWRLPTVYELQTILLAPYPCETIPCVDQTLFGPSAAQLYWTGTTIGPYLGSAWQVFFNNGRVDNDDSTGKFNAARVRAVRGGV